MAFGVWNNLDEVALYLGLERFSYETDEKLFSRLKKFSKWKYRTDYYTQMHSIPLQVGLDTFNVLEIYAINSELEFKCSIDWEYFIIDSDEEYIRVFINTEDATLKKITDQIDKSENFNYRLIKGSFKNFPIKYLVRNKNYRITRDFVTSKSFNLSNKNLQFNSLTAIDTNICKKRRDSLQDLKRPGDYFLDEKVGYLELYDKDFSSFYVSYKHYKPKFIIEGSEINLIPLNIITKYGLSDKLINMLPCIMDDISWG